MKYIGIDYGTKRIGIALSDETGSVAFPHAVIPAGREALSQVAELITKEGVGSIVLGESKNFSGEPNPVMEDIEQFKQDIAELTGLTVEYEAELFSSALAARQFAPDESSRKANPSQEKLDASAAAVILQSYLDKKKPV
jgi:putative holliday junction resolvase